MEKAAGNVGSWPTRDIDQPGSCRRTRIASIDGEEFGESIRLFPTSPTAVETIDDAAERPRQPAGRVRNRGKANCL
jgi:hypothetical protein